MSRRLLPAVGALALVATSLTGHASAAPSTVVLTGNLLPGINLLTSTGDAPAGQELRIGVGLQRPHPAAEQAFLAGLSNPASPDYRHYLTPAGIAARFGVSRSVTDLVVDQLRSAGLHVDTVATAGDYVSAYGPVSAVEKAFRVDLRSFSVKGTSFLANTTAPTVPAAAHVISVVGLNTLQHFAPGTTGSSKGQDICAGGTCTGTTTPQDLWGVYDQPDAFQGQGVRAAVIGEGSPATVTAAMPKFAKHYGLPAVPLTTHCVEKNDCGADTGGDVEWEIDTQAIAGMAPKTKGIDLYFSKQIYDGSLNLAFLGWIDDAKGPATANASLYECEATPANSVLTGPLAGTQGNLGGGPAAVSGSGNGEESVLDPQLMKAAMQGRTLFTISGDVGSSCGNVVLPGLGYGNGVLNQGVPEQSYPGVSPYVTTVGGTVLYTNDGSKPTTRALEYAWTFGGGGTSYFEPAPSWQADTPAVVGRCASSPTGDPSGTGVLCRGVPDVSAQSGDVATNGYGIVGTDGAVGQGGGTSLSSPLWVGMWTRVQSAALARSGTLLGFASPLLYTIGNGTAADDSFYDITVGANGTFAATPGWDYNTGFGSPRVAGLIAALAPARATVAPPPRAAPPARPAPVAGGSTALPTTGLDGLVPAVGLLALFAALAYRRRGTRSSPLS